MEQTNIPSIQSTHNPWISCAKGLAIVLMVIGHSGAPETLVQWIYNFHMPLFFFVSGYLFNIKYLQDGVTFIKKKFKSLYIPFVKWSLIFLILHNMLTSLNLYGLEYDLNDFKSKIIGIFTMTDSEQLLGGFWFLKQLLYASVISWVILYFLYKRPRQIKVSLPITIASIVCVTIIYAYSSVKIPTISCTTLSGIAFFLTGYAFRKYSIFNRLSNNYTGGSILIFSIAAVYLFQGSMFLSDYKIGIYFVIAVISITGIIWVCQKISKTKVAAILDSLGTVTLYILIFHFSAFKLVSYILINAYDYPIDRLTEFPVMEGLTGMEWILYSIAGILIPVALYRSVIYSKAKIRLKTKAASV